MNQTPPSAVHEVPALWQALAAVGATGAFLLASFGMMLPRMVPYPAATWIGFALAAPPVCMLVVTLANPAARRVQRTADGLVAQGWRGSSFVAWDAITGVRDRPLLGRIELAMADGTVVRLPRRLEGLAVVLAQALEHAAPRVPHTFHGSPWLPSISLLGMAAVPASALLMDGVLMVAWILAIAGLFWLVWGTRTAHLTASMLRLERPFGRRIVPLRAVVATRLVVPGPGGGGTAAELLTAEDEVVRVALPIGRLFLFYAALIRQLRELHGEGFGAWPEAAVDEPADEGAVIRSAVAAFEARTEAPWHRDDRAPAGEAPRG